MLINIIKVSRKLGINPAKEQRIELEQILNMNKTELDLYYKIVLNNYSCTCISCKYNKYFSVFFLYPKVYQSISFEHENLEYLQTPRILDELNGLFDRYFESHQG